MTSSAVTDASGNYQFSSLVSGGSYTVVPSKAARTPGSQGINTIDIVATQRHFLQIVLLTGCRLSAADVNSDALINTIDIVAMQRFFLGSQVATANTGKYKFIPASRAYSGLVDNQNAQNYEALVFGDVVSPFVETTSTPTPTPTVTPSATPTATATATIAPTPTPTSPPLLTISGTVSYCSRPIPGPVPNVILTLSGSLSGSTLSDDSGNYLFSALPSGGNYSITPSKTPLTPTSPAINTVDVVAIQRHFLVVGAPLSGCRLVAADVDRNSLVNTIDVVAVQRFFLGFTNGIANTGRYNFTPPNRSYSEIITDQTGQNYDTLVFGDVATPFAE